MSERLSGAMGRALAFCAEAGDRSFEGFVERAAWELHHETANEISSLAFIVRRHDGSSFVGRPRELSALPVETLLGLLVEEGGSHISCRVRDHALDTIRFIDARFRTSIVVRVALPKNLVPGGEAALWFGLQGGATPKKVELAQTIGRVSSEWLATYGPVIQSVQGAFERHMQLHERLVDMTSIAHDARAPLGALQYLLADLAAIHPEMQSDAARLRRELQYVDALLEKFSPREASSARSVDENTDVCQVVQRVCERFVQEVRVHDGRFSLVFPPNRTVVVRAPELDCERILSNVIGNAVRYAGKDEIRIEVVRDYSRTIRFLVSDRGPGFPRSVIDAVRLGMPGGGRVKDANGWGVGLVSCKKRLVALGGDLTLESGSGGSTVTIALPEGDSSGAFKSTASEKQPMMASASRAQATDVADADGVPALAQLEHELIIIDDDTDHSESLERVLRRANVLTRTFSSVTEAMAHIERAPHARVVCDVHMPDGGAEKLLQMVTMLGRAVPCAVMSGETSDDVLYRFAALGAREFFAKPASIDRLIAWARV